MSGPTRVSELIDLDRLGELSSSELRDVRRRVDGNRRSTNRRRRDAPKVDRPEPAAAVIPAHLMGTIPGYLVELEQLADACLGPRNGMALSKWVEHQVERLVAMRDISRILVRVCVQEGKMDPGPGYIVARRREGGPPRLLGHHG